MRKKTPLDLKATFGISFEKHLPYVSKKVVEELYSQFMNSEREKK